MWPEPEVVQKKKNTGLGIVVLGFRVLFGTCLGGGKISLKILQPPEKVPKAAKFGGENLAKT